MGSQMKEVAQKSDKSIAEQSERFKVQLRKEKEAWLASEKVRKEKWEADKIREIREGTVQKLEPTIQSLIEKHKEELRWAEERTNTEGRRVREALTEEFEVKLTKLRDRLLAERDEALEREREKL